MCPAWGTCVFSSQKTQRSERVFWEKPHAIGAHGFCPFRDVAVTHCGATVSGFVPSTRKGFVKKNAGHWGRRGKWEARGPEEQRGRSRRSEVGIVARRASFEGALFSMVSPPQGLVPVERRLETRKSMRSTPAVDASTEIFSVGRRLRRAATQHQTALHPGKPEWRRKVVFRY
jgi:hypothetical protein